MNIMVAIAVAARRTAARVQLWKRDRELWRTRVEIGRMVNRAQVGDAFAYETLKTLIGRQTELHGLCEELGRVSGVGGPFGEPR